MLKRLLIGVAAGALALPAAASAAAPAVTVSRQAVALQGRALFRAELTAAAGAQPVQVKERLGLVRFVDLGGDLKVACTGRGKQRTTQDAQGRAVVTCAGLAAGAQATGSHFRIEGFALRFGLQIPDGYTGTVQGRVRPWQPGQGLGKSRGQGAAQTSPGAGDPSLSADLAAAAQS